MADITITLPLSAPAVDYWKESRRPLVALVFLAPLLACYEAGVLLLHVQNGADAWMRRWLDVLGFGQHFLLPLVTVAILLAWHHVSRQPWRVSTSVLAGMAIECVALALVLWLLFRLQAGFWQAAVVPHVVEIGQRLCNWVGFLGAGVYEELLFRVILLSLTLWLLGLTHLARGAQLTLAIVATSLLFSAAHYANVAGVVGEPFAWPSFAFRFMAGVYFSLLFVYRGFGIAAGTHAAYDILVG